MDSEWDDETIYVLRYGTVFDDVFSAEPWIDNDYELSYRRKQNAQTLLETLKAKESAQYSLRIDSKTIIYGDDMQRLQDVALLILTKNEKTTDTG